MGKNLESVNSVNDNFLKKSDKNCVFDDGDAISILIGHMGWYQFFWSFVAIVTNFPALIQFFGSVFQV